MSWLDIAAYNLGYRELNNKPSFMKKLEIENKIDFLSANILLKGSDKTIFKPYVIKELIANDKAKKLSFKKIKIGIVGLCDNNLGQIILNHDGEPAVEYRDPVEAAKNLLPELKKKTDIVILLYYGKYDKLKMVLTQVPGFDVAVLGGETYLAGRNQKEDETSITVTSQAMGKYVGILYLNLDKKKKIKGFSTKQVPLDENIKDDPKFTQLVKDFDGASQKPGSN